MLAGISGGVRLHTIKIADICYPLCWPSLTKDIKTEQLLCWSGKTDTEHSTTSDSNEEDLLPCFLCTSFERKDFLDFDIEKKSFG